MSIPVGPGKHLEELEGGSILKLAGRGSSEGGTKKELAGRNQWNLLEICIQASLFLGLPHHSALPTTPCPCRDVPVTESREITNPHFYVLWRYCATAGW